MEETVSIEVIEAGRFPIIYDGWSKFGEHYFGLFATYITMRLKTSEHGGQDASFY